MTLTITLPDDLVAWLQLLATAQHRSLEEVALDLLRAALVAEPVAPTLEEVVARIRATPPNPAGLRPASGSLADALVDDDDADFDVAAWNAAWSAVEAELAANDTFAGDHRVRHLSTEP